MRELVIGYVCIAIGILIMGFSVYSVYAIFTQQSKPFTVFQTKEATKEKKPSLTTQELMTNPSAIAEMQTELISGILEKQMGQTINIGATIFLYYFVMLFGFRIAMIGTNLVRPIQVKLRSNTVELDVEQKKNELV